jgi:hypothetical protein
MKKQIITVFLCLAAGTAFAQQTIITDRPDRTESAFIVPKNKLQIEAGLFGGKEFGADKFTTPTSLFRYGVTEKFELRLETTVSTPELASGLSDGLEPVRAGFKYLILEEKGWIPQYAAIVHGYYTDIASEPNRTGELGFSINNTFSYTLVNGFSTGVNLLLSKTGDQTMNTAYTWAVGKSISEKFGAYAELFGFSRDDFYRDNGFQTGGVYLPSPNQQFDLSVGTTYSGGKGFYVSAGYSVYF